MLVPPFALQLSCPKIRLPHSTMRDPALREKETALRSESSLLNLGLTSNNIAHVTGEVAINVGGVEYILIEHSEVRQSHTAHVLVLISGREYFPK